MYCASHGYYEIHPDWGEFWNGCQFCILDRLKGKSKTYELPSLSFDDWPGFIIAKS